MWGLATAEGRGWVREVWGGAPIVTGDPDEAQRWPTRHEAIKVAKVVARRRVQVRLVELHGVQRLRGDL